MPYPPGPGGATRLLCECDMRTLTDLARNIVKESDLSGGVCSPPHQNIHVMYLAFKT